MGLSAPKAGLAGRSAGREGARRARRARARRLLVIAAVAGVAAVGWRGPALWAAAVTAVVVSVWPSRAGRWAAGAAGERATDRALAGVEREGWEVLADVRLPGRRWNLDHVLIGPAGVVVVETKQWREPVRVNRRHPRLLDERVGWQVDAVSAALRQHRTPVVVRGFLCVHGAPVRRRWWTGARWAAVGDGRHLRRWLRRLPPGDDRVRPIVRRVFEAAA